MTCFTVIKVSTHYTNNYNDIGNRIRACYLPAQSYVGHTVERLEQKMEVKLHIQVLNISIGFIIPGGRLLKTGIQKLLPRYEKCLNSESEYVGKKLNTCCIYPNKFFH